MEVTPEQIMAVLQQRATNDRLIAEIVRAAAIEASAIVLTEQQGNEPDQGETVEA